MINKLQRRKRNTTGFLKTFFNDFWTYVLENGENYSKFVSLPVGSQNYNSLINAYDLIGKVFDIYLEIFVTIIEGFHRPISAQ